MTGATDVSMEIFQEAGIVHDPEGVSPLESAQKVRHANNELKPRTETTQITNTARGNPGWVLTNLYFRRDATPAFTPFSRFRQLAIGAFCSFNIDQQSLNADGEHRRERNPHGLEIEPNIPKSLYYKYLQLI